MSKSSRDVGKIKRLKQTSMGQFFSFIGTSSKKRHQSSKGKMTSYWGSSSERDTEDYRDGYPNKKDKENLDANVRFYKNEIESKPDGALIEVILEKWWGDYKLLERHHGYIQWLFPIREDGMNWHAQELQKHEIDKICEDKEAHGRVLKAYKMMLDFYGMRLENDETGKIERTENWEERFKHLNKSFHNYLRITRILKCLGELGYEHLKKPFIEFVLYEAMVEETLPNLLSSCYNYWINVLRDEDERIEMWKYYQSLDEKTAESSDEETNESCKKPKMNESKIGLESPDLKTNENGHDTLMEQVEPKQKDDINGMYHINSPAVKMEVDGEKDGNIEKPDLEESDNELDSVDLKESDQQGDSEKLVLESVMPLEGENENNKKRITLKDNINGMFHINSPDVKMEVDGEKNESIEKPDLEESDNEIDSADLKESDHQGDSEKLVLESDMPLEGENENNKKLKEKNESKNVIEYADLNGSGNEKVLKQEDSIKEDLILRNPRNQVDNIKESTQTVDSDVLIETENGNNETIKIMKVESENDGKSANMSASATDDGGQEETSHVSGPEALILTKVESENNEKANMNGSDNEKVNEPGVSSTESNIEKPRQGDDSYALLEASNADSKKLKIGKSTEGCDPDVLMENYQQVASNEHEVTNSTDHKVTNSTEHEVTNSTEHEVTNSTEYEVTNSTEHEVTNSNEHELINSTEYEMTNSNEHEVTNSTEYEVTNSNEHEVTNSNNHEVTNSIEHKVTNSNEHEVTNSTDHEMTNSTEHQVTNSSEQEVTNSTEHQVTNSTDHEMTNSTEHQVTNSTDHKMTNSNDHQVTNSTDHEMTNSNDHQVTNSTDHEMTEVNEHEVTNSTEHEVTNSNEHEVTNSNEQEVTNSNEHEVTNSNEHEMSNSTEHQVTNSNEQEVTNSNEHEVTNSNEHEMTNNNEHQVTKIYHEHRSKIDGEEIISEAPVLSESETMEMIDERQVRLNMQ